jgi:16S rRNA (cytosine967-C5)-methyltransferase
MTDLLRCALPVQPDLPLAEPARRPWIVNQALTGLAEARKNPAFATPNLARWFRKNRSLGSRDRRVVSEMVHGIIRHEALLLRAGARSPEDLARMWADIVAGERFDEMEPATPAEDFATALNVPGPVAAEWLRVLGAERAAEYGHCLTLRPAMQIRTNTIKITRDKLIKTLENEGVETVVVDGIDTALTVQGRANLLATKAFSNGLFEVQDASSQQMCAALPIEPGTRVLDLCAGAGGKSLALAARGAQVTATDIREKALVELEKRAVRAGADITLEQPSPADIVLIDAPCSGSGRLRRNPALRWGLTDLTHRETQNELLNEATEWVEPGGHLVYATCSLFERENHHPTPKGWLITEEHTLWPHIDHCDGFYWRVMRREEAT